MAEDKRLFVQRLNEALIECGNGRYDYLKDEPMEYQCEGEGWNKVETVSQGGNQANVTFDSLTAIMKDINGLF